MVMLLVFLGGNYRWQSVDIVENLRSVGREF